MLLLHTIEPLSDLQDRLLGQHHVHTPGASFHRHPTFTCEDHDMCAINTNLCTDNLGEICRTKEKPPGMTICLKCNGIDMRVAIPAARTALATATSVRSMASANITTPAPSASATAPAAAAKPSPCKQEAHLTAKPRPWITTPRPSAMAPAAAAKLSACMQGTPLTALSHICVPNSLHAGTDWHASAMV